MPALFKGGPVIVTATALSLAAGLGMTASPAVAKRANVCASSAAKKAVNGTGKGVKTLKSGQYYAFGTSGGWMACNGGARSLSTALKTFTIPNPSGQTNLGVKLYSRPNRCLVLALKPDGPGYYSFAALDMRKKGASRATKSFLVDGGNSGASVVKAQLSSTCVFAFGYRDSSGARHIQINPVTGRGKQAVIDLSTKATDADLRAFSIKGNNITWSDGGVKQTRPYNKIEARF